MIATEIRSAPTIDNLSTTAGESPVLLDPPPEPTIAGWGPVLLDPPPEPTI